MSEGETIREQARNIPIFRRCDVLVVGGGPAGCAAAASAAEIGADTILIERYGHLGGMSTGGLVLLIDRMTDWTGRQVIAGFANDVFDRMPREAVSGPPKDAWGSKDPQLAQHWEHPDTSYHGTVMWSPTVDPEMLKITYSNLVVERGVKLLLHCWAVAPIKEGDEIGGIIFESKSGRQAILAKVVIDATGDGDIFALAGASFEGDTQKGDIHSTMNVAFRWGGCDFERYSRFRHDHKEEFEAIMAHGAEIGVRDRPVRMPRNDMALFMGPRLSGYSCINVEDLTAVELESRRLMLKVLHLYQRNIPGFEGAWIMDTAPQIGVRHSRRLVGLKRVTRADWTAGKVHEDEIGVYSTLDPRYPNASIPLGCLIPVSLDNLLVAGRNLSCDAISHAFLRLIPAAWLTGQAAGVAAAVAADCDLRPRDVDIKEVQRWLTKQGAYLQRGVAASKA
jgi:hypothetical protein